MHAGKLVVSKSECSRTRVPHDVNLRPRPGENERPQTKMKGRKKR
jgi:hypothetical protein